MLRNPRTVPIIPEQLRGGPDQVVKTPYELEEKEGIWLGTKMDSNALGIYGRPRTPSGDVVLPPTITDAPGVPDIPEVIKSESGRRTNSMLGDYEISPEEMRGAQYFESIRRSDRPTTTRSLVPPSMVKGKRKGGKSDE